MGLGGKDVTSEDYVCTLPESLRKVALEELREDDSIRQQSLDQMREWINKNSAIKTCRKDAPFLLRFLRTKKFSVPLACEMLERYLMIRQLYPQWFRNLDSDDNDLAQLVDSGYIVPLPQKHNGKTVIFTCAEKFDPYKFTAASMIRIHSLVAEVLMDDEENQVNGYVYVNDIGGFQLGHISLWSLKDIRNVIRCVQNSSPMRHKESHFVNVSPNAAKLVEFGLTVLSEKLKNRTFIHKSVTDLHERISPSILPKEYGGVVPLADMINAFKSKIQDCRKKILALDDLHIEIDERNCALIDEMNEELGVGIEGSFKKLQVD
ncbi:hypothetical protein PPYR_11020 [Photinus pyralis]|uniref:CRAL-TRIO domain-containing protein n=1 Tax=Photinus pyralis TaxID=7054 RepID=A0A1Y1MWL1_PHOPY|nr:clavesin-1 [Photinus pyralis]KAB0796959.1 hypothetical protein PPYR_11020 [Photinus pyralis]